MTVTFFELPAGQGSATITQVASGGGYCTASDVASLNKARVIGQGNNPTLTDVNGYIEMVAGQIDAVLITKGYLAPVNTASYPEAEGVLAWINSTGAWAMMEEASPNSPNVDRARKAFDAAMEMLSDAKFTLNVPLDTDRSKPRGPYVTFQPSGEIFDPLSSLGARNDRSCDSNPANPYFSRQIQF